MPYMLLLLGRWETEDENVKEATSESGARMTHKNKNQNHFLNHTTNLSSSHKI